MQLGCGAYVSNLVLIHRKKICGGDVDSLGDSYMFMGMYVYDVYGYVNERVQRECLSDGTGGRVP